ncbi:flagellar protein FlaG [Undibacterium pigrum]|uniref:Flagellar protein FlaG n=1 Tax=Undibacterium pigrum TaxID=401470 RepID=A0A318JB27_9BURK|nr:flagellar protein FlaG [Undibacterium pigrum]PXX46748.1 flagellar protein FlaG [Undibacterium pigrum]
MDVLSITSSSPGAPVSDRLSNAAPAPQIAQSAAPLQTANPVRSAGQSAKAASADDINKAVAEINKSIQVSSQNLEFSVDNDAKEVVVKIVDQQTKQVIRQIPTEEALEIAKSLDKLQGLLIKQTA